MELIVSILVFFLWEVLDNVVKEGALITITVLFAIHLGSRRKLILPKIYGFIILLATHFILCMLLGYAEIFDFIKQFFGISLTFLYYYNILYGYSMHKVMQVYCKVAFVFSVYGLLQEFLGLINVNTLVSLNWLVVGMKNEKVLGYFQRCIGLCSEPFNFGMLLLPALYFAMLTLIKKEYNYFKPYQSIIVVLTFICTFSSAAYLGAFVALWLLLVRDDKSFSTKKIKKVIVALLAIIILFYTAYSLIPEFSMRVVDLLKAFISIQEIEKVNLSSYALASSYYIVKNIILTTKGCGIGLGSYGANYERFSTMLDTNSWKYGINSSDANSMALRLIAELGIFAILLIIYFIRVRKITPNIMIDPSNAMLSILILKLIRSGNYIFGGTMFFVCAYILCSKNRIGDSKDVLYKSTKEKGIYIL